MLCRFKLRNLYFQPTLPGFGPLIINYAQVGRWKEGRRREGKRCRGWGKRGGNSASNILAACGTRYHGIPPDSKGEEARIGPINYSEARVSRKPPGDLNSPPRVPVRDGRRKREGNRSRERRGGGSNAARRGPAVLTMFRRAGGRFSPGAPRWWCGGG